jgi:hypothetical protein
MNNNNKTLAGEILKITSEIQENYPELMKYLEEMQDTLPGNTTENPMETRALEEYLNSLKALLTNYKNEHK